MKTAAVLPKFEKKALSNPSIVEDAVRKRNGERNGERSERVYNLFSQQYFY